MHILYLSFPGGGLDTNVRVLSPELVKAGHRVSVLYIDSPGASRESYSSNGANGYKVYHASSGAWHYYLSRVTLGLTRLPRLVRAVEEAQTLQRAVEEIQDQYPLDLIELPEIFVSPRWVHQVPYIVRLHASDWMLEQLFNEQRDLVRALSIRLESHSLRRACAISSPSAMLADFIRHSCQVKQPITIIPYPVDTSKFVPGDERAKPPVILFVGRVEKRKGADVLMRAASRVWAEYPDCNFVFAGRVCDDIKEMTASIPPSVQFLGVQSREQLVTLYQRAAILAVPSLWDNSPNTIYEAMACGTPVIASRVGGVPELVEDGGTGQLFPSNDSAALADAILSLLADPGLRERMGQRARDKAVALYSLDRIAGQTMEFYNSLNLRASNSRRP